MRVEFAIPFIEMSSKLKWVVRSPSLEASDGSCRRSRPTMARFVKELHQNRKKPAEVRIHFEQRALQSLDSVPLEISWISNLVPFVRVYLRLQWERINATWYARDTTEKADGVSAKLCDVCVIFDDLLRFSEQLKRILQQISCMGNRDRVELELLGVGAALVQIVYQAIPNLLRQIERYVSFYVQEAVRDRLKQYGLKHKQPYLVLSSSGSSSVLVTFLQMLTLCTCGDSSAIESHEAVSEREIVAILQQYGFNPVLKSCLHARPQSTKVCAQLTGIAASATLRCLLQSILSNDEPFDEFGVYKLYRILLKLQELVSEVKPSLGLALSDRLVQDTTIWHKGEAILQVLNHAVFAQRKGRAEVSVREPASALESNNISDGGGPTGDARGSHIDISADQGPGSSVLSAAEQAQWQGLVHPPGRSIFPRRSRRHKGTVFTTLQLNVAQL